MTRATSESAAFPEDRTEVLGPAEIAEFPDEHTLPQGMRVGAYVLGRPLGRGGGGEVYKAVHEASGRRVAVKVLRPEMAAFPVMLARFAREVEALKTLAHPNVVALYDYGEIQAGQPYFVMEYLDGVDLRSWLARYGRLSPVEALEIMRPICDAVDAAHRAGIIHRDLKVSNVVVLGEQGNRKVKLLDFGIAKPVQSEQQGQGLTEPGAVIGSAHTMAPEQIRCERVDERTDVYALGVMLFQLLTGQFPFEADDSPRVALMHLTSPAPRPSLLAPVSPELDAVVLRAMEKQREQRFSGPLALLAALERAVGSAKPGGELGQAVALSVRIKDLDPEQLDDAQVERLLGAFDLLEGELVASSFLLPLRTTVSLLGVRILSEDERSGARQVARALAARLAALASAEGITLETRVAVGDVEYQKTEDGVEICGGPLLDVDSWSERAEGES